MSNLDTLCAAIASYKTIREINSQIDIEELEFIRNALIDCKNELLTEYSIQVRELANKSDNSFAVVERLVLALCE